MDPITTLLSHIHALAVDIGPRGPTTEGERKGHEYCLRVFERLGLDACLETYTSAKSIFQPHLIASAVLLASFIIYPMAGKISALIAVLLALIGLGSDLLELSFRPNPIRWLLSKGPSQNAFAVVPPSGEHRQDIVLIGHVDTQRTPIVFSSKKWVSAYETFTTVAFVTFAAQVILYFLGAFTQWSWIWPFSAIAAVCAVLLAALCIQADSTPFTAGANDNASAVGMVLTLAEQIQSQPLAHTRVWCVCTGCEEVQHYGAADFYRRHRAELVNPKAVTFEMLGCAGPSWLIQEGIVVPFYSDPNLRSLAERLSAQHPEWKAYGASIKGGNTEMADALLAGIPAITLTGLTPKAKPPIGTSPKIPSIRWMARSCAGCTISPGRISGSWIIKRKHAANKFAATITKSTCVDYVICCREFIRPRLYPSSYINPPTPPRAAGAGSRCSRPRSTRR